MAMKHKLTRGQIRKLLHIQNGRCAISGVKLDPKKVSIDHIIPLSRKEFMNDPLFGKYWLVDAKINKLKGALTLDELYEVIENIRNNITITKNIKNSFKNKDIEEMNRKDFDEYINNYFDENGIIKDQLGFYR